MIDLRGYDAHVHGTRIVFMSDGLAHDLHRCGYCGPQEWAAAVNDIMANAIDTGDRDDGIPGWYFQSEVNLVDDRGVTTVEVCAERFHDAGVSVFYPDER